jgi:hypothetical protein
MSMTDDYPHSHLVGDNISELALGRYGIVLSAAFLSVGLGTLGLAFTISHAE